MAESRQMWRIGRLRFFVIVCLCLVVAVPGCARGQDLDSAVRSFVDRGDFSGVVLVARGNRILLEKAYGYANREWDIANTIDTKFRIGSVSKQFTAACILLLAQEGKLSLQDSITKYLPDAPRAWAPVTLHQLLTHTSGIPNVTSLPDFSTRKTLPATLDQMIARIRDLPLEFPPGTEGRYSNSGFIILARVVERVSGETFAEFLAQRILRLAGLNNTGTDNPRTILKHRASGYTRFSTEVGNADYINMSIPVGGGSLYSTADDLYRWILALYSGQVIESKWLDLMTTPTFHNYGYGIEIRPEKGGRIIDHGGGIEGFNAFLQYRERDCLVVVVLSSINTGITQKLANELAQVSREIK